MKNTKKLELTLCGMLPYGLNIKTNNLVREMVFEPLDYPHHNDGGKFKNEKIAIRHVLLGVGHKPLLNSMEKLTEPILEGGLIPMKILFEKYGAGFSHYGYFTEDFINSAYVVHPELMSAEKFELLKSWHFNIFDLPKEMYIEKSELKTN